MSRLVVESSDPNDSEADIEDKLEKAARSVQISREAKGLTDPYLKELSDTTDTLIGKVFDSMVDQIAKVLEE